MDWHKTLKDIYSKLKISGHEDIASEIHEAQLSGGTGGEVFDIVISKLVQLKNNNISAYTVIKGETDTLIKYAKDIGYLK